MHSSNAVKKNVYIKMFDTHINYSLWRIISLVIGGWDPDGSFEFDYYQWPLFLNHLKRREKRELYIFQTKKSRMLKVNLMVCKCEPHTVIMSYTVQTRWEKNSFRAKWKSESGEEWKYWFDKGPSSCFTFPLSPRTLSAISRIHANINSKKKI